MVASAGVGTAELLGSRGVHRLESFQRTLQINLTGTFMLPVWPPRRWRTIHPPLTASVARLDLYGLHRRIRRADRQAATASKAGIVGMTLLLAREGRVGIRVMAIAPGPFAHPLAAHLA